MTKQDPLWTRRRCTSSLAPQAITRVRAVLSRLLNQSPSVCRPWDWIRRHSIPQESRMKTILCRVPHSKRRTIWILISKILKFFCETRKSSSKTNTDSKQKCSEISRKCGCRSAWRMPITWTFNLPARTLLVVLRVRNLNYPTVLSLKLKDKLLHWLVISWTKPIKPTRLAKAV